MKSLIFLFTVVAVAAQTTVTVTGPTTVAQGTTATLSVAVAGTAGTNLSALQFTAVPPVGVSLGTPVITTTAGTLGEGCLLQSSDWWILKHWTNQCDTCCG